MWSKKIPNAEDLQNLVNNTNKDVPTVSSLEYLSSVYEEKPSATAKKAPVVANATATETATPKVRAKSNNNYGNFSDSHLFDQ